MPELWQSWAPRDFPPVAREEYTAIASTYEGGPKLLLFVQKSAVDRLWYGVVAYQGALLPTWKSPSGFVKHQMAQQWAEAKAESVAEGMLPLPLQGGE